MTLEDYIGKYVEVTLLSFFSGEERIQGRVVEKIYDNKPLIVLRHIDPKWNGVTPTEVEDGYYYWGLNYDEDTIWYKDMVLVGIEPKKKIRKHKMII